MVEILLVSKTFYEYVLGLFCLSVSLENSKSNDDLQTSIVPFAALTGASDDSHMSLRVEAQVLSVDRMAFVGVAPHYCPTSRLMTLPLVNSTPARHTGFLADSQTCWASRPQSLCAGCSPCLESSFPGYLYG